MAAENCYNATRGSTLTYSSGTTFSVMLTLFAECSSSTAGGAIFASSSQFNGMIKYCTFQKCYSGYYGGAVAIETAASANISNICYSMNGALLAPNMMLWSDAYDLVAASNNYTSESQTNSSEHGTAFGGRSSFFATCNNITGAITTAHGSGILLLNVPSQLCITYLNSANGNGPGTWYFSTHGSPTIALSNTINNTITSSFLIDVLTNTLITFSECVFIGNTVTSAIYGSNTPAYESGTIVMNGCLFDAAYVSVNFGSVTTTLCSFGAGSSNIVALEALDNRVCNACKTNTFTSGMRTTMAFEYLVFTLIFSGIFE